MNIPAPKLSTILPDASNLSTAGRFDPAQEFVPHLSATQMDLPSGSTLTALVAPHIRPSGSIPQFRIVSYGLGRSLIGWTSAFVFSWAITSLVPKANITGATKTPIKRWVKYFIVEPLSIPNSLTTVN